ncbi:MAG: ABC transporter permease subunit [Anaerolineales bacterium]|nr:ABC transporter permease subunit [Anaerolineales bacterium]
MKDNLGMRWVQWIQSRFSGRRGRRLKEYLTAYLMIFPAVLLIFIFGIFPVGFALYVSLHKWRLKRGDFIGIDNYVRAVDNLIYVLLFALAIGALVAAFFFLRRLKRDFENWGASPWLLTLPAVAHTAAVFAFIRWTVLLLPQVLDIANIIVGLEKTRALFFELLGDAFRAETVLPAFRLFILLLILSIGLLFIGRRFWRSIHNIVVQARLTMILLAASIGFFLLWFTYMEAMRSYRETLQAGGTPDLWAQVITISSGVVLLVFAWLTWRGAEKQESDRAFWIRVLGTMFLLVGGWVLIGELPMVIAAGDKDMWAGLKITIFYSLGTVPFQLAISLFLAVLLFQQLAGSEFFRMLFFLPYVTPFVASAAVFRQMFSVRPQAPVNQALQFLGLEPLRWIQEPQGVLMMLGERLGVALPAWAAGPSLALVVVMIYSIWVYVGYDTVIYLAGLGNISTELLEAAEIDGAGRWQIFRYIIFPLLSPTTYFLSLIAVIGTFKAFSHIWVMRHELALGTVDTFSVTIFLEFFDKVRYGYASALAFVLFAIILGLTVINNRIQGSRVFYG